MKRPAAAATVRPSNLTLRRKRQEAFLQAQRDAVAGRPPCRIWAGRLSAERKGGKVAYSVPLQRGLSAEVLQIKVEANWTSGEERAALLVQDLKAAIARQLCGNSMGFNIVCDRANGPPAAEGKGKEPAASGAGADAGPGAGGSAVLLDMETLELHCLEDFDAEAGAFGSTLVPNLRLLFDGKPKYFETHDNGGRPFRVGVTRNSVSIHDNYNPRSNTGTYERDKAPLLAHFDNCKRAFVGVSSGSCWCDHDTSYGDRFGNSILVCLEGGKSEVTIGLHPPRVDSACFQRLLEGSGGVSALCSELPSPDSNRGIFIGSEQVFVFVGDCIYVFKLPDGDEIVEYYSMIGNSDVPYPVAVGKKFLYFMLDRAYVPREDINEEEWLHDPAEVDEDVDGPRWEDAYRWFYSDARKGRAKPFPSCLELARRS